MTHRSYWPFRLSLLVAAVGLTSACGGSQTQAVTGAPVADSSKAAPAAVAAPVAAVQPHQVASPHGTRADPYFWLRDDERKDKDVLAYLERENAYAQAMLAPTEALQKTLYDEIVGRLKQDDSSVPYLRKGYWYYVRFETGREYPIYARKKHEGAPEEIMLDVNELASGHDFYRVGATSVSPDGRLLAYTVDSVGRNQYQLHVKDLRSGAMLADTAGNISPAVVWANDNKTLFYIEKHPTTLLGYRVRRHVLGTDSASDPLVYEEKDTSFYTGISKTKSDAYIVIALGSTVSSEYRLIDANRPATQPRVFLPRERDHEYDIDHLEGRFVVRSNWKARNFRLFEVAEGKTANRAAWTELVPHSQEVFIHSFGLFRDFMAVSLRSGGLRKVRIVPDRGAPFVIDADEPAYTMYFIDTPEPDSRVVRYLYMSMTTPPSTYELDVSSRSRTLLKREPVLGDFDPARYTTEYVHATARDGARVPVSLVYRKGTRKDGGAPLLVYGYGSYGASMDPGFNSSLLSLLDRGFVYAVAHIRGGQEMGRAWYDDGKLLAKKHTFTDFIDVTEFLVQKKYAARDAVFAMGGSAGGLLMGAVINMRPDIYRGIVAHVPFVDVVTTMLDDSIPLTSNEYDEWGDPRKKEYYDYMLSYSPYDNVAARDYPAMLVTTGLWDSQVQYFEPAKWVAKLRALKTDRNPLLLHVNMDAGHGGKSGRYQRYREIARDYAFLLHTLQQPDARRRR